MSDETPTQKFEAASIQPEPTARRRLVTILVIVGALLAAAVVLLVIILTRGTTDPAAAPSLASSQSPSPTPSSSMSPSATPTPSPSATTAPLPASEAPQATGPEFSAFNAPSQEPGCSSGGPSFAPTQPNVKVSWATTGAVSVWFVTGNSDAADSGFMQLPLAGDQNDFPYPVTFGCSSDSTDYTLTLVGPDGQHVHKRWTVTNTGDKS